MTHRKITVKHKRKGVSSFASHAKHHPQVLFYSQIEGKAKQQESHATMYSSVESSILVKRALHPAHQVTLFQRQKPPGTKPAPLVLLLEQDHSHADDNDRQINEDHNTLEDISVDSSYLQHSNPPKSVPRTIVFNKDGSNPTSNLLFSILASMVLIWLLISSTGIFHPLSFSDPSTNHSTPSQTPVLPVVKPFRPVKTVHAVVHHVFFRAEARSIPSIRRQRLSGSNTESAIRTSTEEEEERETEMLDKQDNEEWDNFWTTHLGGIV